MGKPSFSIVIPLYNSENYIIETLQSLVNQSNQDFEVIIVNDNSSDNSVFVTNVFLKNNPNLKARLFIDRPAEFPKGVSGSRNYGIHMSEGEWICFLDSDDLFHPQKIEQLKILAFTLPENVMAIFHTPMDFNDGDQVYFDKIIAPSNLKPKNIIDELVTKNIIYTSAVCIKKEVLEKTGVFDVELSGVEDYYLWLQISKYTNWLYLPLRLTAYRIRLNSLMGGRRMNYYIKQNDALVRKVKGNALFSNPEKYSITNYFMHDVMGYYATISINNHGWSDFFSGITSLFRKGYWKQAMQILGRHVKFFTLKSIVLLASFVKRKKN